MNGKKKYQPTPEQIAARAHAIWLKEGCPTGRAETHWALAEKQLQAEATTGTGTTRPAATRTSPKQRETVTA